MAGLRGDFAGLSLLRRTMLRAGSPAFRKGVNAVLAQEAMTLIAEGFEQGADPYGTPWLPVDRRPKAAGRARNGRFTAARGAGGLPLQVTGNLKNGFHPVYTEAGFTIDSSVIYAAIHQFSGWAGRNRASFIPQRAMLPLVERGLGPKWTKAFREVAAEQIQGAFR